MSEEGQSANQSREPLLTWMELTRKVSGLLNDYEASLRNFPDFLAALSEKGESVDHFFALRSGMGYASLQFDFGGCPYRINYFNTPKHRELQLGKHFVAEDNRHGLEYVVFSLGIACPTLQYGKEFEDSRSNDTHRNTPTAATKAHEFLKEFHL